MATCEAGVLMRISPYSALNEIPSTSYVQERPAGCWSWRNRCRVRGSPARLSGNGCRELLGLLYTDRAVGSKIRAPWKCGIGNVNQRRRLLKSLEIKTLSGFKEGEESSLLGTPDKAVAILHSIEQSGLRIGGAKERSLFFGDLTFIFSGGGSGGGGKHGGRGDGDDNGHGEEDFENSKGKHMLAGLLTLFSLLFKQREGLRSCLLCLSAASLGLYLSSTFLFGGAALALTASSFSKPRRLADGSSAREHGDDMPAAHSGKDLVGAIWEVKGSKWRRFILDIEKDRFVPDVLKQNEAEAEAYELACQEVKSQEFAKSEVEKEYATLRYRLAEQVKRWELEESQEILKTAEVSEVDSLAAQHSNSNLQIIPKEGSLFVKESTRIDLGQLSKDVARSIQMRLQSSLDHGGELMKQVMLPEGYPRSVTDDYTEFTVWRMGQIIASQISGVLTTQALLYAVGLGKGAIPTAAAINWVLRDGIGYLSKIMLSKYGRHFDVHPKGWRMLSDLLENASYGLELLTPVFPHLFVYLGAVAGAGRSAAGMIQAATKSCFNAGFAAQRNFAEVVAKGEAQGMVSKSIGIALGIAVSGYVGSSGPQLLATFAVVTGLHMFFNLKSYQAVQLRTLNPYRASLVLSEYLRSGSVPSVREVNAEEPIFPRIGALRLRLRGQQEAVKTLSGGSKQAAESIDEHLEFGSMFGSLVHTREEADNLLPLYEREQYILAQRGNRILVVLKESVTPRDMLRALFQVTIMRNLSVMHPSLDSYRTVVRDCEKGGILELSHKIMSEEFERMQRNLSMAGWVSEGLVARPSPNRLLNAPIIGV